MADSEYEPTEKRARTDGNALDDAVREVEQEAAAHHAIEFVNGDKLQIEFYYDPDQLSLDNFVPIHDVEDLCFLFSRIETPGPMAVTTIDVSIGEHTLSWLIPCEKTPRLRIGPFVAQHVNVRSIFSQGSKKFEDSPAQIVRITVTNTSSNKSYEAQLGYDVHQFLLNCGARGVITDEGNDPFPSEVVALHSEFFKNIFYGGFKEAKEKWVEIPDLEPITILFIIAIMTTRSFLGEPVNRKLWKRYRDILEQCDRFAFVNIFEKLREIVSQSLRRASVDKDDTEVLGTVQALAIASRDDSLMHIFANRFCLVECMDTWMQQHAAEITPDIKLILTERRSKLESLCGKRSKLRLEYTGGAIECTLFDDLHPTLVRDLLSYTGGIASAFKMQGLPALSLSRALETTDVRYAGMFASEPAQHPERFYLLYHDRKPESSLIISDKQWPPHLWLLGEVTAGQELLRPGNYGPFVSYSVEPGSAHTLVV